MKFKKLRKTLVKTDAVQMLRMTDSGYDTWQHPEEVPKKFDDMEVCGISIVTGGFTDPDGKNIIGDRALEVLVDDRPKKKKKKEKYSIENIEKELEKWQ